MISVVLLMYDSITAMISVVLLKYDSITAMISVVLLMYDSITAMISVVLLKYDSITAMIAVVLLKYDSFSVLLIALQMLSSYNFSIIANCNIKCEIYTTVADCNFVLMYVVYSLVKRDLFWYIFIIIIIIIIIVRPWAEHFILELFYCVIRLYIQT